jgi:hypothetical protein
VEDKGELQRTEGVSQLNITTTGYGLVVKEEVGLSKSIRLRPLTLAVISDHRPDRSPSFHF